jgi:hypothetical protein
MLHVYFPFSPEITPWKIHHPHHEFNRKFARLVFIFDCIGGLGKNTARAKIFVTR